jgi:hypothetical protein
VARIADLLTEPECMRDWPDALAALLVLAPILGAVLLLVSIVALATAH